MKKLTTFLICISYLIANCSFAEQGLELTLSEKEKQKLSHYFPIETETKIIWKGDPINIYLPIGQEKRIIFENHVSIDLKGSLNTDQIKVLNNDKSIYLTALQSFSKTRIYVTDLTTNKVMLIDLSVNEGAANSTQRIVSVDNIQVETTVISPSSQNQLEEENQGLNSTTSYVDLIRFAWQQTYSPENLKNKLPTYNRVPMKTNRFLSNLVYGDKVIAHPEGTWLIGSKYVTVVFLQNKYQHATSINLKRDLCGNWLAASLYPRSNLKPYGAKKGDSTTLFLVSGKPFNETIRICYGNA
jgi:integrating conjugative element protein (TIGR03749 family)